MGLVDKFELPYRKLEIEYCHFIAIDETKVVEFHKAVRNNSHIESKTHIPVQTKVKTLKPVNSQGPASYYF